jgi:hypothetical protein
VAADEIGSESLEVQVQGTDRGFDSGVDVRGWDVSNTALNKAGRLWSVKIGCEGEMWGL